MAWPASGAPALFRNGYQLILTPVPGSHHYPGRPGRNASQRNLASSLPAPCQPGEIGFHAAQCGSSPSLEQLAGPLPSRRQSIAFVRAELRLIVAEWLSGISRSSTPHR
jgi:hypothetical protein